MAKDGIFNDRIRVGVNPQKDFASEFTLVQSVTEDSPNNPPNFVGAQFTSDRNGCTYQAFKARGSTLALADVVSGDRVSDFNFLAYSGSTFFINANIRSYIDGVFVSGQAPPMNLVFETGSANGTPSLKMYIDPLGDVGIGPFLPGTVDATANLHILSESALEVKYERFSTDTSAPFVRFVKSRGTIATPLTVAIQDRTGVTSYAGYTGALFNGASEIVSVDAAVVAGQMPGMSIRFLTAPQNGVLTNRVYLTSNGSIGFGPFVQGTTEPTSSMHLVNATTADFKLETNVTGALGASTINLYKTRGSIAVPTDVVNGDTLGTIRFSALSTTEFGTAKIAAFVDAVVVAGQRPASRLDFFTNANNGGQTVRFTIDSAGLATFTQSVSLNGATAKVLTYTTAVANAAVAVTFGGVGPTGSTAGNPQGWMRVNMAGTDRYIPFW